MFFQGVQVLARSGDEEIGASAFCDKAAFVGEKGIGTFFYIFLKFKLS